MTYLMHDSLAQVTIVIATFSATEIYDLNYYTGSAVTDLIDNVDCNGTESKLIDCSHNLNFNNSYTSPRVECQYCKH